MYHKLAAVLLLCALVSLGNAQPIAAEGGEIAGRPWWMGALSFTLSVFAVSSTAIGVAELAVSQKRFWMAQILAATFLAAGLFLADVGTIFFWMAVLAALTVVIVNVAVFMVKTIARRVVR